jgi:hypothetical protein
VIDYIMRSVGYPTLTMETERREVARLQEHARKYAQRQNLRCR